jgi:hypothetical protein
MRYVWLKSPYALHFTFFLDANLFILWQVINAYINIIKHRKDPSQLDSSCQDVGKKGKDCSQRVLIVNTFHTRKLCESTWTTGDLGKKCLQNDLVVFDKFIFH